MTYEKNKITIILEDSEVKDFWDIISYALDYDNIAKKSKPGSYVQMTESQIKLAEKLELITRPSNV